MKSTISTRSIKYKGVVYSGCCSLYNSIPESSGKVKFTTFYRRIKRGMNVDDALYRKPKISHEIEFNGITFRSRRALYTYLTRTYKGISKEYSAMCYYIERNPYTWQDTVVDKLREKKRVRRGFLQASKKIGACDNLVWQRVHTLGWSVKRAKETPLDSVHRPIPVTYNGTRYKSISACYKAVKPSMSLPCFKRNVLKI